MRSDREFEAALAQARDGANPCEISRATRIPRSTIREWIQHGAGPMRSRRKALAKPGERLLDPFPALTEHAYAYLLGLYLGDGHLASMRRGVFALRIYLDTAYPRLLAEAEAAMSLVNPSGGASRLAVPGVNMAIILGYSKAWPELLPQHGPGMKHRREIQLVDWQERITKRYPDRLLRGLIHSDGCRSINTIRHAKRTYRYPRYQFCNHSQDIKDIFCEYCDRVGVEWRVMNRHTISIARRDSVAKLDRLIGPKR